MHKSLPPQHVPSASSSWSARRQVKSARLSSHGVSVKNALQPDQLQAHQASTSGREDVPRLLGFGKGFAVPRSCRSRSQCNSSTKQRSVQTLATGGSSGESSGPESSSSSSPGQPSSQGNEAADPYAFQPPEGDLASYVVPEPYSHTPIATPEKLQETRHAVRSDPGDSTTLHLRTDFASRARITPLVTAGGLGLLPEAGMYSVELERDYSKEWPAIKYDHAQKCWTVKWGFLEPFADPDLPPYYYYKGVEFIAFTAGERVAQAVASVVYVAGIAAMATVLYCISPQLLAAASISWSRNTLSLGKWAVLFGLLAAGKLWLYWVFLIGKIIDGILAQHAPGVRQFAWANFVVWVMYMAITPVHWYPLPFIAPQNGIV